MSKIEFPSDVKKRVDAVLNGGARIEYDPLHNQWSGSAGCPRWKFTSTDSSLYQLLTALEAAVFRMQSQSAESTPPDQ